jgi:hypothetical protein
VILADQALQVVALGKILHVTRAERRCHPCFQYWPTR